MKAAMRKVLFVCFGNLCRSPMAEGFLNSLGKNAAIVAESAGVGAVDGTPPSLLAVLEMKRRGVDIARHRARNISSITVSDYAIVVALDRKIAALFEAACPDYSGLQTWVIPDPYGGSAGEYREAADLISSQVEELFRNFS
jgi:protein-tyrosine phosphatase